MKIIKFAFCLLLISRASAQEFDEFSDFSAPIFVSPARMASSLQDSPVSVTRLETEDLRYLGIDTIVDAMRLVPGMIVSDIHGSNSVIGYHGSNVNVPRRMEVLFNSNSIYRPGYSNVHWHRLPIDIPDLTAVEIIRGSNVVDFGSNAFSGTVNMIQKQPVLEPTFALETTAGSSNKKNVRVSSHFSSERAQLVARYFREENSGFDSLSDGTVVEDDLVGDNILLIGEYELSDGLIADVSIASNRYSFSPSSINTVFSDDPDLEYAIVDGPDPATEYSSLVIAKINKSFTQGQTKQLLSFSGSHINFKREQDFDLCLRSFFFDPLLAELDASPNVHLVRSDIPLVLSTALNNEIPELNESIVSPLNENDIEILRQIGIRTREIGPLALLERRCGSGDISVDETRKTASFLYSREIENDYTLVVNGSISRSIAESQHYLAGTKKRDDGNVAVNYRHYFGDNAIINMGGNFEASSATSEIYPSYRAAFNYIPSQAHIIRLLYSHSERSPDIHELEREWNYDIHYDEGVTDHLGRSRGSLPRIARSPDSLKSEKIDTIELGYIYTSNPHTIDVKLFEERQYDLISEPFFYLDFNLTNSGENTIRGVETAYEYQSYRSRNTKFGVTYTHLDNSPSNPYEQTLFSENFGSVYLIFPVHKNITVGTYATYYEDLANEDELRFNTTVTYSKKLASTDLRLSLNYFRAPDNIASFTEISTEEPIVSSYSNRDQWSINLSIEY